MVTPAIDVGVEPCVKGALPSAQVVVIDDDKGGVDVLSYLATAGVFAIKSAAKNEVVIISLRIIFPQQPKVLRRFYKRNKSLPVDQDHWMRCRSLRGYNK